MNLNEQHDADVVLSPPRKGSIKDEVWIAGEVCGIVSGRARDIFVWGCAMRGRSVYDARTGRFIAGSLEQLQG
jgi:hypothetical protein